MVRIRVSNWRFWPLLALATLGVGVACYPGDPLSSSETDIVTTFFDPNYDFASSQTYAMPDTIFRVDGDDNVIADSVGPFDAQVLSRIAQNMTDMGFERIADPGQSDVQVITFNRTTRWVAGSCYPWYGGGWWGYPPGWGWCYPVTYTYETGTILILMGDDSQADDQLGTWVAGINGVLSGSSSAVSARIDGTIDQAFDQSPYLGEGK